MFVLPLSFQSPPPSLPLQTYLSTHLLDSSGRWGRMQLSVWTSFVDWLAESGLLTRNVQSRSPQPGTATTTLDSLRAGDVGERIPREEVAEAAMFTNELLPA